METNRFNDHSFFDSKGLLHVEKGVFSENGVLFAAEYWIFFKNIKEPYLSSFFQRETEKIIAGVYNYDSEKEKHWFDPNPSHNNDINSHYSHDNMTGLYCLGYFTESFEIKQLPIIKWNCVKPSKQQKWYYKIQKKLFGNYLWFHPRDFLFYLTLKNNILGYLGLPLLFLISFFSAFAPKNITSGKCKWLLAYLTLNNHTNKMVRAFSKLCLSLFSKTLKKEHGSQPFIDVFNIYFKNEEHPIHNQIKKLYETNILK
jgi:hypothetical protein